MVCRLEVGDTAGWETCATWRSIVGEHIGNIQRMFRQQLDCLLVETAAHEKIGVASALFEFNELCAGRLQSLTDAVENGVITQRIENEDVFADAADRVLVFITVSG